jgi:hypothetical protein
VSEEPPNVKSSVELESVLSGIGRCTTDVENEIFFTNDSVVPANVDLYNVAWRGAFFPTNVTVAGNHQPLVERAIKTDVSLLRITSLRDFSYRGSLLNLGTLRQTKFFLYPESDVSLLVRPGGYLLIISGEVTFPSGQIWRSPKNVMAIEAPDSATIRSFILKTRVRREE